MSTLDLKLGNDQALDLEKNMFEILSDYLQANATSSQDATAQKLLSILPKNEPHSTDVWLFGQICIEIAEQIPYHHPSQLKLVMLVGRLGRSTQLGNAYLAKDSETGVYYRFQRLKESLRDSFDTLDEENTVGYVNFSAFAANLEVFLVESSSPDFPIWMHRDAFENEPPASADLHSAQILAAAQYILWAGQRLFKQVLYPGEVSLDDLKCWRPGPLYRGEANLSLQRWHFWRDGYRAVASKGREEKRSLSEECIRVATKAVDMMDVLASSMTF